MEISLPNGAKVSLDADVDAEALRRVLLERSAFSLTHILRWRGNLRIRQG